MSRCSIPRPCNGEYKGKNAVICSRGRLLCALAGTTVSVPAAEDDFFSPIEVDLDERSQQSDKGATWDSKGSVIQKFKYGLDTPLSDFPFHRDDAGLSQVQTDWFHEWRGSLSENTRWQFGFKAEVDWLQ